MQYISTCYHTLLNQLKSGRYALPDSFHLAPTSPRPHSFFPLQSSPKYFFNLNFKLPLSCSLFPHFSSHTQPSREAQMFAELESLLLAAAASPAAEGCGGKAKRNLHALAKTRHSKRFQDSLTCGDMRRPHGGLQFMVWKMYGLQAAVSPLIKMRHAPCS